MKCHKSYTKVIPFLLHCILVAAGKAANNVGEYLHENNYEKGKALNSHCNALIFYPF